MRDKATLVLLVRHGLTPTTGVKLPGRAPGLSLSEEGRRQADAAAARIGKLPSVTAIYASSLERARETAQPIARARHLAIRVERGLLELDVGEFTGLTLKRAHRRPEWSVIQRNPSGFRFPGGESFADMQARMTTTLAALVDRHRGQTIVAVSHADPIKAAVAQALGTPLDLFQRIVIAPASITAIVYRLHGPSVLTVNSVDGDLASRAQAVNPSFDLETPDHFTVGAVGPPGQRVFYLQAREGRRLVTLKVEKEQVRVLAEYLAGLLARLKTEGVAAPDDLALLEPVEAAWNVGSIGVGYDQGRDRIVIEAGELPEEESEEEAASARFRITRAQAVGLVERSQELMRGSRPICPLCTEPMDPAGHFCPRRNGHSTRKS